MTQVSRPQQGQRTTYADAGGYTANEWARIFSTVFTLDRTVQCVVPHLSDLEVTNPAGVTIRVANGAAMVNGHWFVNEDQTDPSLGSNVDFVPSTPAADRIDRVVLVQNNTDNPYDGTPDYGGTVLEFPTDLTDYGGASFVPAHSCRLAILTGVSGGAMRALTQDVALNGDIWMVELARYTITNAPVVSVGPTDYRQYIASRTRNVFIPAISGYVDGVGELDHTSVIQGWPMADNVDTFIFGGWRVPGDFVGDLVIRAIVVPGDAGDMARLNACNYGSSGEAYNTHSDSNLNTGDAVTAVVTEIAEIDAEDASAGDVVFLAFSRTAGTHGTDTVAATIYCLGWVAEYTADG